MDGDPKSLQFLFSALKSSYRPYDNRTETFLATFTRKASPSRFLLGLLFQCLWYVDDEGQGINPAHVPLRADHFISKMRRRTPLLRVTDHDVEEKDGSCKTTCLSFALNDVLQRVQESPSVVKEMLSNPGGHVLSPEDRLRNRVPANHFTPIATERPGNQRRGFLHGEIAACSSLVGLDCIVVGPVDRLTTGETVMARFTEGDAVEQPCRLAFVARREASASDELLSRLVARLHRLIHESEAGLRSDRQDVYDGPKQCGRC